MSEGPTRTNLKRSDERQAMSKELTRTYLKRNNNPVATSVGQATTNLTNTVINKKAISAGQAMPHNPTHLTTPPYQHISLKRYNYKILIKV